MAPKTQAEKIDEMYVTVATIKTELIGVNGSGGLKQEVQQIKESRTSRWGACEEHRNDLHGRITENDKVLRKDVTDELLAIRKDFTDAVGLISKDVGKIRERVTDVRIEVAKIVAYLAAAGIIGGCCYGGLN